MRLWSIHPSYLDSKGLVALWREGLGAAKALQAKAGYYNHPQLLRFKAQKDPLKALRYYLYEVYLESVRRGYHFNVLKIVDETHNPVRADGSIEITDGQLEYELAWLKEKLIIRDQKKFVEIKKITGILQHPIFKVKSGAIADWEKVK